MGVEAGTSMEVPKRVIPVPASVSPEAQAVLSYVPPQQPEWPSLDDTEAWVRNRVASEEMVTAMVESRLTGGDEVESVEIDGVPVYVVTPAGFVAGDNRLCLDIHGGGLIMGGGDCCRATGRMTAQNMGMRVWSVDYRMPPEHRYPAALDDCVTVYRAAIDRFPTDRIVVAGASAGGNLAAALLLRARDEGLPLPAAVVLQSPEVDLTESGDSFQTNYGVDTVLTRRLLPANELYAGGHDLSDPYLSPLFGNFTAGFPPATISTGTRDLFLSNAVRLHRSLRAAGMTADLHVFEAMPHGGFMVPTPEEEQWHVEVDAFIRRHCPFP